MFFLIVDLELDLDLDLDLVAIILLLKDLVLCPLFIVQV